MRKTAESPDDVLVLPGRFQGLLQAKMLVEQHGAFLKSELLAVLQRHVEKHTIPCSELPIEAKV